MKEETQDTMASIQESQQLVGDFLQRIYEASLVLSQAEEEDHMMEESNNNGDVAHRVEQIAKNLLKACNVERFSSGTSNLPTLRVSDEERPFIEDEEDQDVIKAYRYRRSDYLRKLLRVMAPISMNVAASVCSTVLGSKRISPCMEYESIILFSHWLPVAPHLASMVTEFLQKLNDPWNHMENDNHKSIFLVSEACYYLSSFYAKRGEIKLFRKLWDWKFVFYMLQPRDVTMSDGEARQESDELFPELAIRWFSVRILATLLDWKPLIVESTLRGLGLNHKQVPWLMHPWELDKEAADMQNSIFRSLTRLWGSEEFILPSSEQTQEVLPLSNLMTKLGPGLTFYKYSSLDGDSATLDAPHSQKHLILTPTTCKNLSLLGCVLCQEPHPPPILVCGPHGSGKSSLVRELLRLCRPTEESLLEFHIDEETDSKTLIGSYTTTDIPGEFAWRAGALTHATREGHWVLIEDVDSVPVEIQATLVKLLEDRMLPLGNGKYERCHPNFRIFGTCTTRTHQDYQRRSMRIGANRGGGKRILSPSLWRNVHVKPLPFSELKQVASSLYPSLPESVIDCALSLLEALDRSGRSEKIKPEIEGLQSDTEVNDDNVPDSREIRLWTGGRDPSVRDFFKLLSRISNGVTFESNKAYATEAQRTLCLAECVDIFVGSCPDRLRKRDFVNLVAAPIWGISRDLALSYVETRRPPTLVGTDLVEIGRVKIHLGDHVQLSRKTSGTFAQTNHALRLMEAVGVCIRENEPVLLVGETGCGKTTLVQQLAISCERELIVQNLSLQTDSTDLLGGYKPLEIRNVARIVYQEFVNLFVATFSRKQNAKFLQFAASMLEKASWKKLSQCFQRASQLGQSKMKQQDDDNALAFSKKRNALSRSWNEFAKAADRFERQRLSCDAGLAFVFSEGVLVDAIRSGKWVLLDEINLASSDTLQRLCGLLDDPSGSVTLTERGDASAVVRHPNFRLFAAMNPATDAGKKDLPASIRSRFSELYVDELLDPVELRVVASRYLDGVLPMNGKPPEHLEIVVDAVDVYLKCRHLAATSLSDGGGHKPRYTMRTLSRALSAAKNLVIQQRIPLDRAVFEGFQLSFEGSLDTASVKAIRRAFKPLLPEGLKKSGLEQPGRRPGGKKSNDDFVLIKPFWIFAGPQQSIDWSEVSPTTGKARFILTPSILSSLRRLSRALAAGPWPILLEGPTSAGKTTLVEYIAARCGHEIIRINNHEHTDVQEYTGSFVADQSGSLIFRDGLLVRALRFGHWVILDELNLAPSEVLEALNRLLDDNRELYLAEINETVKPHPNFRLFATQNPCGAYGGRKPLSRAFRNRFVEIHMGDIPSDEMVTILEKRCGCPPSHSKRLVEIMDSLRNRRSRSNVFLGKDSFITPRDLLRWAERQSGSKQDLAEQGYMLLAERLRSEDEKVLVSEVLEEHLKVKLDMEEKYYGDSSEAKRLLDQALEQIQKSDDSLITSIAATKTLLRLISLVLRCIEQKEPVLLVGDTGCGKTTVVQFLSFVFKKNLYAVNCHATTETSDLLGGLRPVRGRDSIFKLILIKLKALIDQWPDRQMLEALEMPDPLPLILHTLTSPNIESGSESFKVKDLVTLAQEILKSYPESEERTKKRRKLSDSASSDKSDEDSERESDSFKVLGAEIEDLGRRYASLFEWSDGPLVQAMKSGQMLLLDEMSLAEDAVLERLNSVLEPSRTLVLAEKGDDSSHVESRIIQADDGFRIFATMNPGGDFGKRELSPALRSRFTEIWVPAVTARCDFELVLGRTLVPRHMELSQSCQAPILAAMLTYVEWFNKTICGDKSSPYADFKLTLRDVLSWARFVVEAREANKDLALWDSYCHGACLMHLDGFGLGAGLAIEDAAIVKKKAEMYLLGQIPSGLTVSNLAGTHEIFEIRHKSFGAFPFYIPIGSVAIPESSFSLRAPTTALNMFRILRALQLRKPVLLEGSPGVGKTSLVTALAAASGHKLVRINLSEQTDIADLMGSDLPVQSSNGGASFEWCDGVLLTAIKEGSWVLLDELNLASQSVLEGLNSCLDHRASVYIPELGKSFNCPSTFRVFGAQNPLGQGGGRKGLPKSFLNRFTKVFVDPLNDSDLRSIVSSKYPSFQKDIIDRMINFNNAVHFEVVESREFGAEGSPWEFNLRDVFRWCELIQTDTAKNDSYARDIYYQRFRTHPDRVRIKKLFNDHFGTSMETSILPKLEIKESFLRIGDTTLQRCMPSETDCQNSSHSEPSILLSHYMPLEAVARCVLLKWPCLLVGPAASGKTSIIRSLAELCNVKLVEQCLSPSSDVSELVGSFEQIESMGEEREALEELHELALEFLKFDGLQSEACIQVWVFVEALETCIEDFPNSFAAFVEKGRQLTKLLLQQSKKDEVSQSGYFERLRAIAEKLDSWTQPNGMENKNDSTGHFIWRDGILVDAMTKGYWLVLENVNLCPSSVLDRLNSVMEKDGQLLLSECGTSSQGEGSLSHRLIKPHPNFRVFLTMNPINGEISRAMRNRCIEISLLQAVKTNNFHPHDKKPLETLCSIPKEERIAFIDVLKTSGAGSMELATALQFTHYSEYSKAVNNGEEPPSFRPVSGTMSMLSGLLLRGIMGKSALISFIQVAFEIESNDVLDYLSKDCFSRLTFNDYIALPSIVSIRDFWIPDGGLAHIIWEARALRLFMGDSQNITAKLAAPGLGFLSFDDVSPEIKAKYELFDLSLAIDNDHIRNILIQLFFSKMTTEDARSRFTYLRRLDNTCSMVWNWMGEKMQSLLISNAELQRSFHEGFTISSSIEMLQLSQLVQQWYEYEWFRKVSAVQKQIESWETLNVLDVSFFIYETLLDRTTFACPVTPFFFPFFLALDNMTSQLFSDCLQRTVDDEGDIFAKCLASFLEERNRLWLTLKNCRVSVKADSFLGFEESEFIVQWKWLKKAISRLSSSALIFSIGSRKAKESVDALVLAIDAAIFGVQTDQWSPHSIRKKLIRLTSLHKASEFETILGIQSLAERCTILSDQRFDPFESFSGGIELRELVHTQHPILFMPREEKVQIVAALCTMYWSLTDEAGAEKGSRKLLLTDGEFHERLRERFNKARQNFEAEITKAKVDTRIITVENQFDVEVLERLSSSSDEALSNSEAYADLTKLLLSGFGNVQISALAEFWCIQEEIRICGEICSVLMKSDGQVAVDNTLLSLRKDLKQLIQVVLSQTIWNPTDMRPHQTLLWAIEGGSDSQISFWHLLRNLLPRFMYSMSHHMWHNSFADINAISMRLELPNMWFDDEVQPFQIASPQLDRESSYASARLYHKVRSEFALTLFGRQLSWSKAGESCKYHTIENHRYRLVQYRDMVRMLSTFSFSESKARLSIMHFLLADILEAACVNVGKDPIERLLPLLRQPKLLITTDLEESLDSPLPMSVFSQKYLNDLILPILKAMRVAWKLEAESKEYQEQIALISIHLGLLRVNILAPDSPLDPGRAPLAKISLIDKQLSGMRTKLTAIRLESGFTSGDFTPDCQETNQILDDADLMTQKRRKQEKKVVERMNSAPPFYELFQEVQEFLGTIAEKSAVLELVRELQDKGSGIKEAEVISRRANNWLRTSTAFCQRLKGHYGAYEDIVLPLVESMQMIQDGLLVISTNVAKDYQDEIQELFGRLLQFPIPIHSDSNTIQSLVSSLRLSSSERVISTPQERTDYLFSLSMAALSRLLLKKRLLGLCHKEVLWCTKIFEVLVDSHLIGKSETLASDETIEAMQEREFRDQFPDHRKDFNALLQDDSDEIYDSEKEQTTEAGETQETNFLSDLQIDLLCTMHHELFSKEATLLTDATRTLAFYSSYNAAYQLEKIFGCTRQQLSWKGEPIGSHVFAMALTALPRNGKLNVYAHSKERSGRLDFQTEACPGEAMAAAEPLERLMARATQLLTAFPGHSILLGIGKICEKVRKLDLMATPIGKIMTGLEVILRQAQDWEQHASDRVRLGQALKDIGQLVAKWRKLELESWAQLICAREDRQIFNAKKYVVRFHSILHDTNLETILIKAKKNRLDPFSDSKPLTPKWIWKGFMSQQKNLSAMLEYTNYEEVTELVKTLDTFILTSPLGEFEERLRLLKSLSVQVLAEYNISGKSSTWKIQQSRALSSVSVYYNQFRPMLASKLENLKTPIETKLKDEVKLAKWDEQSYYALAESSERNHRKLMKVLSEMDECLDLNVGLLIQQDTYYGVRADANVQDEFCSEVPSQSMMFPIVSNETGKNTLKKEAEWKLDFLDTKKRDWVDAKAVGASDDSHLLKIPKYAMKMQSMLTSSDSLLLDIHSRAGADSALSFCDVIFTRIGSLRSKGTRQMKERALVDLFRELKRNGFTTTKWAIPEELRHLEHILQLPKPDLSCVGIKAPQLSKVNEGEKYFARCLTELNAFRSETLMLGSKYMTTREMNLMTCLSESVFLMITQQRCLLANVIQDTSSLIGCLKQMKFEGTEIPMKQSILRNKMQEFNNYHASTMECLKQLSLLIKSSQSFLDTSEKTDWARDTITKLESFSVEMSTSVSKEMEKFITSDSLEDVKRKQKRLREIKVALEECLEDCSVLCCLPTDIFEASLVSISTALDTADEIESDALRIVDVEEDKSDGINLKLSLSSAIERILITFQNFRGEEEDDLDEDDASIMDCHRHFMTKWAGINLKLLNDKLETVVSQLCTMHDIGTVPAKERQAFVGLVSDVSVLSSYIQPMVVSYLRDSAQFYFGASKLLYILLRVFRVLVSKGYCSDETSEDDDGEVDGDINGMTFEDDVDGTGMGEGDGKNDVTDQLENEDQLAGLKNDQDEKDEKPENRESKQLNEEEADQGMEMENDFDGEMCDLPDKEPDDSMEEQEGEELDREMGEDASPDEQVVDEKMWNESDDEDDINKEEEKFEKNSGVEGEAMEGETHTKEEDNDESPSADNDKKESQPDQKKPQEEDTGDTQDIDFENDQENFNEDNEDQYEDQHGVDVRGDEKEQEEGVNDESEMQLDEDVCLDGDDNDENVSEEDGDDGDEDEILNDNNSVENEVDQANAEMETQEEDDEEVDPGESTIPHGQGTIEQEEGEKDQEDPKEEEPLEENALESMNKEPSSEETHGIRSTQGADAVTEDDAGDDKEDEDVTEEDMGGANGESQVHDSQADSSGQGGGNSEEDGAMDNPTEDTGKDGLDEIPNPFKNPGDASKFWHKKLKMIDSNSEEEPEDIENDTEGKDQEEQGKDGEFEFTPHDQKNSTQVLGETTEEEATKLDPLQDDMQEEENESLEEKREKKIQEEKINGQKKDKTSSRQSKLTDSIEPEEDKDSNEDDSVSVMDEEMNDDLSKASQENEEESLGDVVSGNLVASDLSKLTFESDNTDMLDASKLVQDEQVSGISTAEAAEARLKWLQIQGETHSLARRLCEKLRLVMEPLVASKLRGDYRTGKRINMKRVIGYIASGYRKDKIWLRRTKPAKRDYRVLLAVDDSESMKKSGAGEMALNAMATLAVGMNQLEIGELGIASFGDDMKLLHPFHLPFTSESGSDMVMNFQFNQQRTRTALCVESALASLEQYGDHSSMQLVFLISDGRIERDSRSALKHLIREMAERNILLAMIIVEGKNKKKDSIVNMKEVTFEKGKPLVKHFIEDYPFPYYMILEDMSSLPEVLGDALRQWFEMLAQLNSAK